MLPPVNSKDLIPRPASEGPKALIECLNTIDGGIGDVPPCELLKPVVRDGGLSGNGTQRSTASPDAGEAGEGIVEEGHGAHCGEFIPRLSRNTFPDPCAKLSRMVRQSRPRVPKLSAPSALRALLGRRVREGMQARKITQRRAAELTGADAKTFSNMCRPDGPSPRLEAIEAAAAILGCEPWELLRPAADEGAHAPRERAAVHDQDGAYVLHGPRDDLLTLLLGAWPRLGPLERQKLALRAQRQGQGGPPAKGNVPGPASPLRKVGP